MKTKKLLSVALSICLFICFAGCKSDNAQSVPQKAEEITVKDMAGRTVNITPGEYSRVVCIGAGALRMYSYVADVSLLCGVEDIENTTLQERPKMFDASARPYVLAFGETFNKLPSCGVGGPNAQTAEAEKILSCNPDIIISEYEDADKADALFNQTGVTVITLKSSPNGIFGEEFKSSIKLLGQVFGTKGEAEKLLQYIDGELEEIKDRTSSVAENEKPTAYICGLGNWGTTNHLMTSETYPTFVVANVKNAVSGLGIKGVGEIEKEKFVAIGSNTDIMFIDSAAVKNIKPQYKEDKKLFNSFNAWNNQKVYLQMAYNAYNTNYEISLANAWFVAKTVYPEKFGDINLEEKLNEITKVFLGKPLAKEIFACPASFGGYCQIDTQNFFE